MERVTITLHQFVTALAVFLVLTTLILSSMAISGHIDFRDDSIGVEAIITPEGQHIGLVKDPGLAATGFAAVADDTGVSGLAGAFSAPANVSQADLETLAGTATESIDASSNFAVGEKGLGFVNSGKGFVTLKPPPGITQAQGFSLTLPPDNGDPGHVLATDGNGVLSFAPNTATTVPFNGGILAATGAAVLDGNGNTINITTAAATVIESTGARLTLNGGGQVLMTSAAAVANAVKIQATNGGIDIDSGTNGIDVDTTGTINIASSKDGASAVVLTASAGGVDITAPGATAGEDINISATGSSVNITSTESDDAAIKLDATLGGIQILASGAAATEDILIAATGSSVKITSTKNAVNAIELHSTIGGVQIDTNTSFVVNALGAVTIGATDNAMTLNSGTGTLSISSDATDTTIAVGTGTGVKGCTFGSANGASSTTLQSGTSGAMTFTAGNNFDVNSAGIVTINANNSDMTLNSGTGALSISSDASNTTVAVGAGNGVKGCTFGSINAGSATSIQAGTGDLNIGASASARTTNICTGDANQTIKIGTHATPANVITIGGAASSVKIDGSFTMLDGGNVAQTGDKSVGVTFNKNSGKITMMNSSLADGIIATFTLTNDKITTSSCVIVNHAQVGDLDGYNVWASNMTTGTCDISVKNISGGSLADAIVLNFIVFNVTP